MNDTCNDIDFLKITHRSHTFLKIEKKKKNTDQYVFKIPRNPIKKKLFKNKNKNKSLIIYYTRVFYLVWNIYNFEVVIFSLPYCAT